MLSFLMEQRFPYRATKVKSMRELFELLPVGACSGPFLAYLYAVDINYSQITDFDEDEFVRWRARVRGMELECLAMLEMLAPNK